MTKSQKTLHKSLGLLHASHGSPQRHSHLLPNPLVSIWVAPSHYLAMVLIDFYQIALSFKLSRRDVGPLPNRSNPPLMPPTTPSNFRLPPDESTLTAPLTPHSVQIPPKTPEFKRDVAHSVPNLTPLSKGASILQKLNPDADKAQKYDSAKYEQYITQDFEAHRVFVEIEVFMKDVLHVPENWWRLWGSTIDKIKRDSAFLTAYLDYSRQCDTEGPEERFYGPLENMTNAILACCDSPLECYVQPRNRQHYFGNGPKGVLLNAMTDPSPDIVAVHDDFLPKLSQEEREKGQMKQSNISWAHPLQVLQVKPSGGALVDGSFMPRLKVNGKPAKVYRDVVSSLMGNRTRSTGEPLPALQAEQRNSPGCRPTYLRRGRLNAGTHSTPEAACG